MDNNVQGRQLAILVGGGTAPGINGVIRAATIEAINSGAGVIGILDGFQHLMEGRTDVVRQLRIPNVASIHFQRGSILRTSRSNPTQPEEALDRTVQSLLALGVTGLVTIGGVNTAFAASQVARAANGRLRVAHVPKTIDNDLPLPRDIPTVGFETARHVGTDLLLNLKEDSRTTERWYFAGVMGHTAGHLALGTGSAAGATLSIIPEQFPGDSISLAQVVNILQGAIMKREALGRLDGLAVIAEGVAARLDPNEIGQIPGATVEYDPYGNTRLAEIPLTTILKREVRRRFAERGKPKVIVDVSLGYDLRSAPPDPFDIDYTTTLGYSAAKFLLSGPESPGQPASGMVYIDNANARVMAFEDMMDPITGKIRKRLVDIEGESYRVAKRYMIRLEENDLEDAGILQKLAEAAGMDAAQVREQFAGALL